jgi:succinate dehydrogenase cytochrome b subunit
MRAFPEVAPKFLNLFQIRFPIGAIASIGHRVSGVVLVVALPLLATALDESLGSAEDFDALRDYLSGPLTTLLSFVVWAAAHHILAGVRHLLMDIGIGSRLEQARTSAWSVIVAALLIALAAGLGGWLS